MKPTILLEAPQYWVVDKPPGWLVERSLNGYDSIEEWLWYKEEKVRRDKTYVGVVHRLDRPVRGVLIMARRKQALKQLQADFESRKVEKIYRALVCGVVQEKEGKLSHYLARDASGRRAVQAMQTEKGAQLCELQYKILDKGKHYTYLEITPHTGRFHQIRAQLSLAGYPIWGDEIYGGERWKHYESIALQAYSVAFKDPTNNSKVLVESMQKLQFPQNF